MCNDVSDTKPGSKSARLQEWSVLCESNGVMVGLGGVQLYDKIRRSEQKYRVALEVLSYHSQCTEEELNSLRALPMPEHIPTITQ